MAPSSGRARGRGRGRGRGRPRKDQRFFDTTPTPESETVVVPSDNEDVREESPKVQLHHYRDVCIHEGLSSSFCFRLAVSRAF